MPGDREGVQSPGYGLPSAHSPMGAAITEVYLRGRLIVALSRFSFRLVFAIVAVVGHSDFF